MLGDICWYIYVHRVIKQQFSSRHQMVFLVLYNLRKCFRKNMATKNSKMNLLSRKAVVLRFSVKKMFLEISQNSQENTFNKVAGLRQTLEKPFTEESSLQIIKNFQKCFGGVVLFIMQKKEPIEKRTCKLLNNPYFVVKLQLFKPNSL